MSSETPTRDPMRDPRPGDRLHDYYHGHCVVEKVEGMWITVIWAQSPTTKKPRRDVFALEAWRHHWEGARHRLGSTAIGRVVEVANG
jgi:hypothetical protein